eukprot:scaffold67399_cov60-Phaeocystis_antarctica.AAC.2
MPCHAPCWAARAGSGGSEGGARLQRGPAVQPWRTPLPPSCPPAPSRGPWWLRFCPAAPAFVVAEAGAEAGACRSAEGGRRCAGAHDQEDPADGWLPQDPLLAQQG